MGELYNINVKGVIKVLCGCIDPDSGRVCNREKNHPGQHCNFNFIDGEGRHMNCWWHSEQSAYTAGKSYRMDIFKDFDDKNPPYFSANSIRQNRLAEAWVQGYIDGGKLK